ncbi:UNVERIFIED_CONTAM: hypothetical protein Sradi_7003200 [Sesamum radiatum]|uniref:Uncharacterized protein n=1 Tax=Sesamum radiatum TaxID=300843 RepID=A0AAW2JBV7_SESRA
MLDPKNDTTESPLLYQRVEISRVSLTIFGTSNTRLLPPKSLLLGQNPNQLSRTPIALHKRAVARILIICLISLLEPPLRRCHIIKHVLKDCLIPFLKTMLQTSQFLLKSHHTAATSGTANSDRPPQENSECVVHICWKHKEETFRSTVHSTSTNKPRWSDWESSRRRLYQVYGLPTYPASTRAQSAMASWKSDIAIPLGAEPPDRSSGSETVLKSLPQSKGSTN